MSNLAFKAVNQYQSADNSSIAYADPHELILRLMNGYDQFASSLEVVLKPLIVLFLDLIPEFCT